MRNLHVGAETGVSCERMQAPVTKNNQRHWEVAGRPTDQLAARILQIHYGLCRKLGREDGIRRGQAISGIEDP